MASEGAAEDKCGRIGAMPQHWCRPARRDQDLALRAPRVLGGPLVHASTKGAGDNWCVFGV